MSKLGYIQNSYGNEIKFAVANTYGYNVLESKNLPNNTVIISSPIDENNDDIGSYSLVMTDYISTPVRLTYTLHEGSGIIYSNDSLKVKIDNDTIVEVNKELAANINELIDNDTLVYDNDKIKINVNHFSKASKTKRGVFKVDERTIKNDNDELFIDTANLNYANKETNTPGIFIGDNNLINVNNGIISLNQNKLHKADNSSFGTINTDNSTIISNDGVLSINTSALNKCSNNPGIVMSDKNTIDYNKNLELTTNTRNLKKANSSTYGVFKYDSSCFTMTDETLKIKNYDVFENLIDAFDKKTKKVNEKISDIDYLLKNYQVGLKKPEIFDFHCARVLTSVLEKPSHIDEGVSNMPYQFITTDFVVSTNCPFIISIKYEDNIDPAIALYQINYDTINIYNGNAGLFEVFQTTEEKQVPLKMTFICKNYYKSDKKEYSNKVKIKIIISYYNDISINKSVIYSIVRFNSGYNEEIEYDEKNIETYINKKDNI